MSNILSANKQVNVKDQISKELIFIDLNIINIHRDTFLLVQEFFCQNFLNLMILLHICSLKRLYFDHDLCI